MKVHCAWCEKAGRDPFMGEKEPMDSDAVSPRDFGKRFVQEGIAQRLLARPVQLVDLQWVWLGNWRAQIKSIFEKLAPRNLLKTLKRIELVGFDDKLMAGWLVERLAVVGEKVELAYSQGTRALSFKFAGGESITLTENQHSLQATIEIGQAYRLVSALEPEDRLALIKRYFSVGESTVNYRAALGQALSLEKLASRQ